MPVDNPEAHNDQDYEGTWNGSNVDIDWSAQGGEDDAASAGSEKEPSGKPDKGKMLKQGTPQQSEEEQTEDDDSQSTGDQTVEHQGEASEGESPRALSFFADEEDDTIPMPADNDTDKTSESGNAEEQQGQGKPLEVGSLLSGDDDDLGLNDAGSDETGKPAGSGDSGGAPDSGFSGDAGDPLMEDPFDSTGSQGAIDQ
ncbi:hypothetical protein Q9290_09230 [Oceanimonas sp. CHS3-5]|uniref:hypothetical protein n=1 Tax=Oceanimonas sp. CHS3-5 TaxID=3068186 RepID=UPI00273D1E37|nr:hypothetical protein [Oceanimonas sp. CHS3-5]MDP5292470.1 hypothetical protein [Oceanimonas sp. CHS3-5]